MRLIILFALLLSLVPAAVPADTIVEQHFADTEHVLTIYHITGKEPGATMMIIGGIQGDEPGGYLAADLYADILLEHGNLIVVPRANFLSIRKQQRGVNGDMNRKFSDSSSNLDYDSRIVEIIKSHLSRCDVLLNLHEGSGFYNPEYVSDDHNPMRYGQSSIIDAATYTGPDSVVVNLAGPAERVIAEINRNIRDPEHHFHLNNHNTFSGETLHAEQRGSATFNALALFSIPGFGIETSKSITSNVTKVKYQTLAINAFMREYGIIPEQPSIYLPTPELHHLVIYTRPGGMSLAVENGESLSVARGTEITVTNIVANYERGLTVDIVGHGNTNDLDRSMIIDGPTTIMVYKDAFPCGTVTVTPGPSDTTTSGPVAAVTDDILDTVEITVGGRRLMAAAGDTLIVVRGDILRITAARTTAPANSNFRVNFYGFVGNPAFNDAEDRGYDIDTGRDLMARLSLGGEGAIYRVDVTRGDRDLGSVYVRIVQPAVKYLIVRDGDGGTRAYSPGEAIFCPGGSPAILIDIVSNVTTDPPVTLSLAAEGGAAAEVGLPASLPPGGVLTITRGGTLLETVRIGGS